MKLTMLYQDPETSGRGCPSVYLAESGELVVQGPELDAASQGELVAKLPNETAVRISPEVVSKAIEHYHEHQ